MKLLRLAPENTKFPFMRFRRVSYPLSAMLSIVSVLLFLFLHMNFGIDFAGGTEVELRAKSGHAEVGALRVIAGKLDLGDVEVQSFGNQSDATLRFGTQAGGQASAQQAAIERVKSAVENDYDVRRVDSVGPRVSGELVQNGILGVVLSIFAVLGYLWFRFEWQFALSAVIATMHDLLLTVGFFSLTQLEFNSSSIAAILTIVGYSLNETVVVLDRIREMMRKYKKMSAAQIIDMSVNAVLPRTIMTATTVFLALLSLAIFGGHVIRSFSLAMIWGIVVATYSSVFICSPMLIYLGLRAEEAAGRDEEEKRAAPQVAAKPKPDARRAKPSTA
ncbi:MAG TPA: protein translocase subunit SecF [Methylocystis sp.]|nr:protein translocase subunit SecF [Methylocystis sp.]